MNASLTGFQKSELAALALREKAADARAEIPAELDPPFPYATESWDPGYWGIPGGLTPVAGDNAES